MSLLKQLTRWKIRGQIDQDVIDIILTLQSRLEHHWRIDVSIPTVITLLLHIANSLARLKRGGCVSRFISLFMMKCKCGHFPRCFGNSPRFAFFYSARNSRSRAELLSRQYL